MSRHVINHRVYDTGKAKKISEWWNGDIAKESCVTEELYQKKNGDLFLYLLPYNGIKLLPLEEVREWSEKQGNYYDIRASIDLFIANERIRRERMQRKLANNGQ